MSPLRVLVVEDDAVIGTLLAEILVGMGYDVSAVEATEADAVTAAAGSRPDLMIVDVQLTDGSGVSAVGQILRNGPIPHVFISGASVASVPFGAVILQKPFRESDLVWAIRRALESGTSPACSELPPP